MARLTRGRNAAASTAPKEGTKHVPLSRRGKGIGKASARTKANGQVKVEGGEEKMDVDGGDQGDDELVRDNSDDSDYEDKDGDENESSSDEADDEIDSDSASDFETVKKKSKSRRSSTPATIKARASPNGIPSTARNGGKTRPASTANGSSVAGAAKGTGDQSAALANEAAGAAAGAYARSGQPVEGSSGAGVGDGATTRKGATGEAKGKRPAINYVCEIAKTGRAMCRRCDEKITKGAMKVGVVTEGSWGPSTQWHHLQCTVFQVQTAEEVEGYDDLEHALQPVLEKRVVTSQTEVDDMYEPITPNDLVRKEWTEKAPCPEEVMATLLPYQAEGLAWMLNQERLPYKGGILADEMGMGKTLQAICTIVANRPNKKDKTMQDRWAKSEEEMGQGGAVKESRGGTLVVCPTIALKQWQSELARFVTAGTLKVVIHHGAKRATLAEDLTGADVVLTTYAIVENEHRKAYAGNKVACPDCGRTLYPDKMFTHRKYFCGEGAQRTEAQAKTQRKKGIAPWRRKDVDGGKGKKGKDADSDGGTTDIKTKAKANKKGANPAKNTGKKSSRASSDSDTASDSGTTTTTTTTTKVNLRVKATPKTKSRPTGKASAKNGNSRRKAGDSSDEAEEDAQTDIPPAKKRKPVARGTTGRVQGKGGGKGNTGREVDGMTKIPKIKRKGKGKGKRAAIGKGRRKRAGGGGGGDDSDSNFEGTTDISGRGKKGKGKAKAKGSKRKRAADDDDSESEWGVSDDSDSSFSSGDDLDESSGTGARALKEAAFAKVLKDMMDKRNNAEPGVLQEISWQRIMLDEAHFIKDRSTSTAKAVFALTSLYKWCLTGTPLQNRVGELYSLVRFLRLDPHAFYQCRSKGCDCKSLSYRFGPEWRACEECGHTPIMHYAYFNRHILNPISRTGYVGEGKKAFLRLKHEVLDQILLRRTKSNRSNDICLPPRIVRVRQHRLDEREEDFYQALYTQSQAQFDTYIDSGTILNNYAHIFDILIRLRQAVDHPYLVIYSATKREGMTPAINSLAGQQSPAAAPTPPVTPPPPTPSSSSRAPRSAVHRLTPEEANGSVNGTVNRTPGARPTRGSSGSASGASRPTKNREGPGGDAHVLGDTSSDSDSEQLEGKTGAVDGAGAIGNRGKGEYDSRCADDDDDDDDDDGVCGICSEPPERPVWSACGHSFCRTCVQELIETAPGDIECPTCSQPLTVDLSGGSPGAEGQDEEGTAESDGVRQRGRKGTGSGSRGASVKGGRKGGGRGGGSAKGRMAGMVAALEASLKKVKKKPKTDGAVKRSVTKHSVINRIDLAKFQSSTKMEALMEEVHLMQERDPAAKAIVFSQFVNMLDLIEYRMHKGGVGCRKLSGHLSVDKREEVLQAFQKDASVKVLLISLKAGGVALNLTVANHIFLMDPWWNPAAEMQAIDRTHRLGQFKPIYATRFIIENTVEERIIKLQEKKQLVFDSTVGGDAVSTGKLTVDDLRFLFAH